MERKNSDARAELGAAVARARLRVDVAKQSVRLAKEDSSAHANASRMPSAKCVAHASRANGARKAWKQARPDEAGAITQSQGSHQADGQLDQAGRQKNFAPRSQGHRQ
ncbi:MAG: hypothetical protein WDM77_21060 [Steroidobacteraceae bacterium]